MNTCGHESTKYIFVTGGVASSLGKGLSAASLGQLLIARGLNVTMQKLDPYLNVDPGTMNPFEHGEVFVTDDGAETDLDLGHYERFLDVNISKYGNVTTGKVYSHVIAEERKGGFLGKTVQVIPHVTDEIKRRVYAMSEADEQGNHPDVVICEIGGTVGDIESLPFLEAARQIRHDVGRDRIFFIHVSLVPYLAPSGELKTKPTQHSVAALRNIGIMPDALILRADRELPDSVKNKIGLMCDVDAEAVIACPDAPSIYDIPKVLFDQGLDRYVARRLNLAVTDIDWTVWNQLLGAITYCRENKKPFLGICLGLQCVVIEAARLAGIPNPSSTEFDPNAESPVISTMDEQLAAVAGEADLGGTMRLGSYPAKLAEGSVVADVYGTTDVAERHRHRYEVNNAYKERIAAGSSLIFSGTSPDGQLVEFVEYPRDVHPYFVATQAHPEFKSRPTRPHPLFQGLIDAAI